MQLLSRTLFLLLWPLATLTASAQPRASVEGVHYQALATAIPTETTTDKIEVRELFWYGCQECSTLEPLMTKWGTSVVGDLVFARTPAVWNDLMALHARLYYTAVELKAADRLHQAAFRAIHEEQNPLRTEDQIEAFFLVNGIAAPQFDTAWSSNTVVTAVQQARLRTADYSIDKLPSVIVNGRYKLVHNAKVFNHVELNLAINNLIRTLRDERRSDF